jgi:hypothetical protein
VTAPVLAFATPQRQHGAPGAVSASRFDAWVTGFEYGLLAVAGAALLGVALMWWRRGLSIEEVTSLLLGPTVRPGFWTRSHIAIHVAVRPAAGATCPPNQPETAHDYLRSISEAAESLTGPARALGSEAINAARQLLASIQALDAEIATLARDADPVEVARIEQKLAPLHGAEADGDEQQMRDLLKSQLELVRRLSARLEAAAEHRTQLLDMLKTLWLQIANLRAQTAEESLEGRDVTDRIHRLCTAIEAHADSEVRIAVESAGGASPSEGQRPLGGSAATVGANPLAHIPVGNVSATSPSTFTGMWSGSTASDRSM